MLILGSWVVPATADSPVLAPLAPVVVGVDGLTEITVAVTDADGDESTLTATSSNAAIATVDVDAQTLTVTGQALGQTTITVTADDGSGLDNATATASFTVTASSLNTGVATVSVNRQLLTIMGVRAGTALIIVTADDGTGAPNAMARATITMHVIDY